MAPSTKSYLKKSIRNAGRHVTNVLSVCDDIEHQSNALHGLYQDVLCKQQNTTQTTMKSWAAQKRRMKKINKTLNQIQKNNSIPTVEFLQEFMDMLCVTESIVDRAFVNMQNEQETQSRLMQNHSRLVENLKKCFGNIKSADLALSEANRYMLDGAKGAKAPVAATFGYVAHSHESRCCEMHNRFTNWDTLIPTDNTQLRLKKQRVNKNSKKTVQGT